MSKIITLLAFILSCGLLSGQEIIWGGPNDPNGSFSNGLNDWIAVGVASDGSLLWQWNEDGIADDGAYAGNDNIESESLTNGAVTMDSDFLDNAGIQGNFEQGIAPAPQHAELISPQFSTKGYHNVYITWTQFMRQFKSYFSIEITSDGGTTWEVIPIEVNNKIPINEYTAPDMKVYINAFDEMGDKDSVQFKFVYDANYYFWTIDDVAVVEGPAHDLGIIESYFPFDAAIYDDVKFKTPESYDLACEITNSGSSYQENAVVVAEILDNNAEVRFETSTEIPPVDPGDTLSVSFEDVDLLVNSWDFNTGGKIRYTITVADSTTFDTGNTTKIDEFTFTANQYNLCNEITDYLSFNEGNFSAAISVYSDDYSYDFYIPELGKIDIIAQSILFDSIYDTNFQVYVFKVLNQDSARSIEPLYSSIEFGLNETHENLDLVASGESYVEESNNNDKIEIIVSDVDQDGPIRLFEGTYVIAVNWESENDTSIQLAMSDRVTYLESRSFIHRATDYTSSGWSALEPDLSWYINLNMGYFMTTSDEVVLDTEMTVFPNPAQSSANIRLEFEEATDLSISLLDVEGNLLQVKEIVGATIQDVEFDVSELAAGIYFFKILTSNNRSASSSFVKVR